MDEIPTHKDNIVDGRFSDIGVAVVDGTLNGVNNPCCPVICRPVNAVSSLEKLILKAADQRSKAYASKRGDPGSANALRFTRTETKEVTTVISPCHYKSISAAIFAVLFSL